MGEIITAMKKREWKIIGVYFEADESTKEEFRRIMMDKFISESDNDVEEALALMAFRYSIALREEAYEECAIMKDIFDYFEYIPD